MLIICWEATPQPTPWSTLGHPSFGSVQMMSPLIQHVIRSFMPFPPWGLSHHELSCIAIIFNATIHVNFIAALQVRGKTVPKPIRTFTQAGLNTRILEALRSKGFERPLPIQAQALPIIMSGRDCIGIAKTGSGKTLAFVLPMLRLIKDQPPLAVGEGPIGLIMAPTRELVQQISKVRGCSHGFMAAGAVCICCC